MPEEKICSSIVDVEGYRHDKALIIVPPTVREEELEQFQRDFAAACTSSGRGIVLKDVFIQRLEESTNR